jgi:hypothetical protein
MAARHEARTASPLTCPEQIRLATQQTLRFVVLWHALPPAAGRASHWDFLLEDDSRLLAWALLRPPDSEGPIAAERLADHRLAYLEYEGPITGDRGSVKRWDSGTFNWCDRSTDVLEMELAGGVLRGRVTLRWQPDAQRWSFGYCPAESATRD